MNYFAWLIIICLFACQQKETSGIEQLRVNQSVVDTIIDKSDSVSVERFDGEEFATMHTYYQDGNNTAKRLLRDNAGNIRAIILMKDGHYVQSRQYFANGQLKGNLSYSDTGILNGPATYYYKDGRIRANGAFDQNKRTGRWKHFDANGTLEYVEIYDDKGQLKETITH